MSSNSLDIDRLTRIFFPYTEKKSSEMRASQGRFVYYTSAETAMSILRSKQIWMRKTGAMNDYLEVEHGFECLNRCYKSDLGNKFKVTLNACFPGLAEEVEEFFNSWLPSIREDTYITCVSEHLPSEDKHGRLSMWRAYGGQTGVAVVVNSTVMLGTTDVLKVFSSPVSYLAPETFSDEFSKIHENMEKEIAFIKSLEREALKNIIFNVFRFAVLCTKHPGFHEEREWRVIASPSMHPSDHLTETIEVIRGTPQAVLRLDLMNHPDQGLVGLAIPELLNKIIIGPCQFPFVTSNAFYQILEQAGVSEPEEKIVVSDIPLRQPTS